MQRTFSPILPQLNFFQSLQQRTLSKSFLADYQLGHFLCIFSDDQTTQIDLQGTNPLSKAVLVLPHYIVLTFMSISSRMASNSSHTTKFIDCLKLSEFLTPLKSFLKVEFIFAISLSSSTTTDLINRHHSIAESFHFHIYVPLGRPSK